MGMSSLEAVISVWNVTGKNGGRFDFYENDDYWYEREVNKGPDYLAGPVTVINFDYLEQQ